MSVLEANTNKNSALLFLKRPLNANAIGVEEPSVMHLNKILNS
jgi:hypothetical protein